MNLNRRHLIGACAAGSIASAAHVPAWSATQAIKYGGSAWLGHYPAYLAMNEGYLKNAGIEQSWESFGTSSARLTALMSGSVDIACTGIVSAMALMARDAKQFSIIAIPETFGRVEGVLGREGIKSVADLKGKKIGVTFASSAHLLVLDVLDKAGLKGSDVTVLNVPAPELPAAMQSGQIDAAVAWTPQFDSIRKQAGVSLLADDTAFSLYKSHNVTPGPDVLVVRRAFAYGNKEVVKAYLKAYFQASDLLREKPGTAAKPLIKLTSLSFEDQLAAIKEADWYGASRQQGLLKGPFVGGLQQLAEMLVQLKQIDKAPQITNWVDASFI